MSVRSGSSVSRVGGSFRDPSGSVFERDGRVFRVVQPSSAEHFDFVRETRFYRRAVEEGRLIDASPVDPTILGAESAAARYVLEHPRLPFVSYPYEWSFSALKEAALFHVRLQLDALDDGVALSDASAYNVQFLGGQPLFIDTLSLRRYREGELWAAHRQFCQQFLCPLLLRAYLGVAHNAWYRGTLEGIETRDLRRLLPFRYKLSRRVLTHVVLQETLQKAGARDTSVSLGELSRAGLPRAAFAKLLTGLEKWIAELRPADSAPSTWADYASTHSYDAGDVQRKRAFVTEFASRCRLGHVWDIGCNTGDYAVAALEGGAASVVGFDTDQDSLDKAFARARREQLRFLPLFVDAANPSPSVGWAQGERFGLQERAAADGILALALVHHLAIGRNVPLPRVVEWLTGLAPRGVVEFVPKDDPKVRALLRLRPDIFDDYTQEVFMDSLRFNATIERSVPGSSTGRVLVEFARP